MDIIYLLAGIIGGVTLVGGSYYLFQAILLEESTDKNDPTQVDATNHIGHIGLGLSIPGATLTLISVANGLAPIVYISIMILVGCVFVYSFIKSLLQPMQAKDLVMLKNKIKIKK